MRSAAREQSLARLLRSAGAQRRDRLLGVRRVHMLHVGKTGGTALKDALGKVRPSGSRILLHRHFVRLADVPVGEPCFFMVRDPVSRFVSGFFSRQRQGRPRYDSPWNEGEQPAFAQFATPNDLARALSSRDGELRRAAESAMGNIGHIRDHLHRWLRDEAYLRERRGDILFVGAQEQLATDVAALSALLDVPIALPTDEVSSHRTPAHLDGRLDDAAIENLRDWYREDYALLRLLRTWFAHLPDYDAAWPRAGKLRSWG